MDCEYCPYEATTEQELKTHILLNHQDKAEEGYETQVSSEYLNTETRTKKGEQFGYR